MATDINDFKKQYNLGDDLKPIKGSNSNNSNKSNNNQTGKIAIYKVPEKSALVWTNAFTGKINIIIGPATAKLKLPWRADTSYVDLKEQTIDYPPREFHTKEPIKVKTDLFIKYEITDPRKYILKSSNIRSAIDTEVQRIMRYYFANHTYEEIKIQKLNIQQISSNEFNKIEAEYGIKITDIGTKTLIFPDILDDTTKKKEQKLEQEIVKDAIEFQQQILPKEREIAIYAAETAAICKTKDDELLIDLLLKKGLSTGQIVKILESKSYGQSSSVINHRDINENNYRSRRK